MAQYFLINKPFGMLSQFTREADHHRVLGDLYPFPKNVYPVGRL
jgi:23S rRNA pseudouridine2457 synthase